VYVVFYSVYSTGDVSTAESFWQTWVFVFDPQQFIHSFEILFHIISSPYYLLPTRSYTTANSRPRVILREYQREVDPTQYFHYLSVAGWLILSQSLPSSHSNSHRPDMVERSPHFQTLMGVPSDSMHWNKTPLGILVTRTSV
jgi:hypothetical protein